MWSLELVLLGFGGFVRGVTIWKRYKITFPPKKTHTHTPTPLLKRHKIPPPPKKNTNTKTHHVEAVEVGERHEGHGEDEDLGGWMDGGTGSS